MDIVVLAGGLSMERDVSIVSGTQVCKALREKGHRAILLDVFLGYEDDFDIETVFEDKESLLRSEVQIQESEPDLEKVRAMREDASCLFGPNVIEICRRADIVYMGLHGADGENGKIQAAFDVLGIRYTGSGYFGSALAMDKGMAKKVFLSAGIPTPKGFSVMKGENQALPADIGYPCVVKPCCGGSSVGVSIATDDEEFKRALEAGFRYEEELLVEECIRGREFSVGVIDGKSLPVIEIIPKEGFYDYKTKYQSGMATEVCPAELPKDLAEEMQRQAVSVFRELKIEVYGRVDFLLDEDGRMYCLEANTLPGMTPTSLIPQEAKAVGIEYGDLCEQVIGKSLEKYTGKKKRDRAASERYGAGDMIPVWTSPMRGMTMEKIAAACRGVYSGPEECRALEVSMITTDSRQIEENCLFVAIRGARVDGNDFVEAAYAEGALGCLSEKEPEDKTKPYIVVESCFQALRDMAKLYRSQMQDIKIVGITGSVGKTTTKEMIAAVLSEHFRTLKTQGNFNNEVGVPLTLFRLRKEHEVAVVEMGISDFGEMSRLSGMVRPDSCVITNIGQCHLENLKDRDGVLRAKTEIFTSMNPEGKIYLNGDDDKLVNVPDNGQNEITFFGVQNTSGVYAKNIRNLGLRGTEVTVVSSQGEFEVMIPVPGKHMVLNALSAAAIALDFGMEPEEICRGIAKFKPVGGHSSIVTTDKFTILNDCYNANPVSMKAGLDVLSEVSGRRVAIVGDMFELGEGEAKMHEEIGAYAESKGIELLVCIGELAKNCLNGTGEAGEHATLAVHYPTKEEAVADLPKLLRKGDTILVKASHGMHFEKIVAVLEEM